MNQSRLNHGYSYRERVGPRGAGLSVLEYYARFYPHSGGETWAARLAAGEIELDGQRAGGSERLRAGSRLVWHRPPWTEEAAPLHFDLVYEDADLLAVSKPSGLPTLPAGSFLEHTLLALLRREWPAAKPLHRLGRGTSGLVLCALSGQAAAALSRAWRSGQVAKRYRALSAGWAVQDAYDIHTPIGPVPHPKLGEVWAAAPEPAGGKPSHSFARVLERRSEAPSTLLDVDIYTGRPHQIRIHLASVGLPLLGDPLYTAGGRPRADTVPSDLGYFLHAGQLHFRHPRTGQPLKLEAAPPSILQPQKDRMG